MKSFLRIVGTAYVGGIVGMWLYVLGMMVFSPSFMDILNVLSGIVLIPFTPLGLPFFIGVCVALYLRERRNKREAITNKVLETYRGM